MQSWVWVLTHPTPLLHDPPHPFMTHPTPPHPFMTHPTPPHPFMMHPPHPTPPLHDPPHPFMTHPTPPHPTPSWCTHPTPPHPFMTHPTPPLHEPPTPPHPTPPLVHFWAQRSLFSWAASLCLPLGRQQKQLMHHDSKVSHCVGVNSWFDFYLNIN